MKTQYLKATSLYTEAARRCEEITRHCQFIEKRITKYPKGKIHIVKSARGIQYYLRSDLQDKSGKYISKNKQRQKINCYLQKRYDEKIYGILKREKKCLDELLINTATIINELRNVYSDNPDEIKNVIEAVDISDEDYAKMWSSIPYCGKEVADDLPQYTTNKGEKVRSKSELNIANMLERNNVPYKYECPIVLRNGVTIYPDFTILNIEKRKVIYWEHRGMMDDREYARSSVHRIKQLAKEGILLGDNLIITEETLTNPLGIDEIERTINACCK